MTELTAASKDGTAIAYERAGTGPAVVLVGGGLTDRSENGPLVPAATAIPCARRDTLLGQGRVTDPDAVAARLAGFFGT